MKPEIKTKRFFTCPNGCSHQFIVEHLLTPGDPCAVTKEYPTRTAGPWYCDDCGQGWRITYGSNTIDVEPARGEKKRDHWVIMELPPQAEPVRFLTRGIRFTEDIDDDLVRFHHEENTCPTNWLRHVTEVSLGTTTDPHGLFYFVAAFDAQSREDACERLIPGEWSST